MWRTGELAKYLGVDRSVLHFYDSQGITHAKKDGNSYRAYSDFDLIALCEARHLRSMGFSLQETSQLLQESDFSRKRQAYQQREQEVKREIKRLSCLKYILANHQGKHRPVHRELLSLAPYDYGDYYYLPLEYTHPGNPPFQEFEALNSLVRDAPYINYCFHFPAGSCIDPSAFRYEFGVSFQAWWRSLAPDVLPQGMDYHPPKKSLFTSMLLDEQTPLFQYETFSFVRNSCIEHTLTMTGEVMAFPSIQFYENEDEKAPLNVFFFLDE